MERDVEHRVETGQGKGGPRTKDRIFSCLSQKKKTKKNSRSIKGKAVVTTESSVVRHSLLSPRQTWLVLTTQHLYIYDRPISLWRQNDSFIFATARQ